VFPKPYCVLCGTALFFLLNFDKKIIALFIDFNK